MYIDAEPHPAWLLQYDDEQGWRWKAQYCTQPGHFSQVCKEHVDSLRFLIVPGANPAALWKKVRTYTKDTDLVGTLSPLEQYQWQKWNLSLPLHAAVLLGAGASYPLRIPLGGKLLDCLSKQLRTMEGTEHITKITKAVLRKEQRRKRWLGKDVNAEDLIAGLEMHISPKQRRLTPRVPSDEYLKDLPYSDNAYTEVIDILLRLLLEIMNIRDKHQLWYFLPLVQTAKTETLLIATLNYDLAVEYACKIANVQWSTGVEEWESNGEFPKPSSGVELLKLHGSITWEYSQRVVKRKSIPEDKVTVRPIGTTSEVRFPSIVPAVIFGSGNKLTANGPFLSLLDTFARRLEEHDLLLVCGYSFLDLHVNEVLRRWFNRNSSRKMIAIEALGAQPSQHWFAGRSDRFMQLNIGAEMGLACLFS